MERVSGSACNDALGVDRVALLFLTRAVMYHDQLWGRWLEDAAGLLPAQTLQARACTTIKTLTASGGTVTALWAACGSFARAACFGCLP